MFSGFRLSLRNSHMPRLLVCRVRGQRLGIRADGNINTLEVSCGLHIPQTSYEIVKRVNCSCVCVGVGGGSVFNKLNVAADERLSTWMFSKNTHNNRVLEMPVS